MAIGLMDGFFRAISKEMIAKGWLLGMQMVCGHE